MHSTYMYPIYLYTFLNISGPKKSNHPNRLSCNIAFKEESSQQKDNLESFNTKDSSDSKSHDSGIDSIEKPGKKYINTLYVITILKTLKNGVLF